MYVIDKSLKNSLYFGFAALFIGFNLTACQKTQNTEVSASQAEILIPAQDDVVAIVGGEDIFYSEVLSAAQRLGLGAAVNNDPKTAAPPIDAASYNTALDDLIARKLFMQDAQRMGLDTLPEAEKRLKVARESILSSFRVETHIRETVTEAAMRKLYDTQAALADFGDEIHARHIVLDSQVDALELTEQLEAGGDFEALAADLSIDPDTRDRGGDLGYFTFDMLAPDFVRPVFDGKKGETLIPFETGKGWHVVEILDRRRPGAKTYEDSRESLRNFLTFDAIQTLSDDLRRQGDVKVIAVDIVNAPSHPDVSAQ